MTMGTVPLLGWLERPRADRGIRLYGGDAGWRLHSYADLARRVNGAARQMRAAGVVNGARVAVVVTDPVRFAEGFFGVLAAGATAVPVAPPTLLGKAYPEYVTHLLRQAEVVAVVAPDEMHAPVVETVGTAGLGIPVLDRPAAVADDAPRGRPGTVAFVQFTSGSTSRPRGVPITRDAAERHLGIIRQWLRWGPDDVKASWLPLYHDMGLVGAFLTSVCFQTDLWQMSPSQFVRNPLAFLRCIGENGATISASPTFGYALMARRILPEQLAGTDFSRWRAAIIGAERVDAVTLSSFARLILDRGFRWSGLRPAYGLAEATLAVSSHPDGTVPRVLDLDWSGLRMDAEVRYLDAGRLDGYNGRRSSALVSCGRPVPATTVTVVDRAGAPLPPGHLGEIVVTSPSITPGYEGGTANEDSTRVTDGTLHTGDAGLIVDGELYVIGRITDCVKVRGRSIYVEQVEDSIAEALGLPAEQCAIVPGHGPAEDTIIAVLERQPAQVPVTEVATMLAGLGGTDVSFRVYAGLATIPRTTSGKKRRRRLAETILSGEFTGKLLYDSADVSQLTW